MFMDQKWAAKVYLTNINNKFNKECILMKKYQIQNSIGNGNFSTVFKGVILPEHIPCAIKIMKSHQKIAMRQAQLLKKFKHPNVINIIDFQQNQTQSKLILEHVGINTLELYEAHSYGLREEQVKCILFQAALGLSCVHSYGIIHRDIKPENILIDKKLAIVKLIDFGLAIDENQVSTDYIATRWYRAPQNLLGTKEYSCAIDVFSLGCVIVELYLGSPLFPGTNNIDQIYKIFNILGYPSESSWKKGYDKMNELGIRMSQHQKKTDIDLKSIMNPCDPRLVQIIEKMLELNPKNRITCLQILKHQYFKDIKAIIPPAVYRRFQQDILLVKSINSKTYLPGKLSKQQSSEIPKKQTTINFHNATMRAKQNPTMYKIVQKPQFLRQKKSTSLDSGRSLNKSITQSMKVINNPQPKASVNAFSNNIMSRKLSTPQLMSHLSSQELLQKTISMMNPFKDITPKIPIRNENSKPIKQVKQSIQIIMEDLDREMKGSGYVNELSQTTNSHISKKQTPITFESQSKQIKPFEQIQTSRKPSQPFIPNVQIASQPIIGDRNVPKVQIRINSPIANVSFQEQSSIKLVGTHQQIPKTNTNITLKPFFFSQNGQKIVIKTQGDQNKRKIDSKIHKIIESRQYKLENILKEQQSKRTNNLPAPKFPLQPISPRQKVINQTRIVLKPQTITARPENFVKAIHHQMPNNKPFLSPTHRLKTNHSPQKSLNITRNHTKVIVKSPTQHFVSPPHQKL